MEHTHKYPGECSELHGGRAMAGIEVAKRGERRKLAWDAKGSEVCRAANGGRPWPCGEDGDDGDGGA